VIRSIFYMSRRSTLFLSAGFLALVSALVPTGFPGRALAFTSDEILTMAIYEKVAPSVVNITTTACEPEFYYCAVPSQTGSGSGVVLSEDGAVVTNYHVVESAETIEVALTDGRRMKAEVVSSSRGDDLAILRVDAGDRPLKAIVLGDSETLQIGEKVLAIGNPFGLGQTLTAGVVSMKGRTVRDSGHELRNMIQTNASINPGNSGGALVNSKGELVGLNTAIFSPTGTSVGIGFAISVNRVKDVVPALMQTWQKFIGWLLAIALVYWFIRRIYRL
jgi:S1-C subfamily serine protease